MSAAKPDLRKILGYKLKASPGLQKILNGKPILGRPATAGKSSNTRDLLLILFIAIIIAFVIRTFIVQIYSVPSNSMEPSIMTKDRIVAGKSSYGIANPFYGLSDTARIFGVINNPFYGKMAAISGRKYIQAFKGPNRMDVIVFTFPSGITRPQKGGYPLIKIIEGQRELIKRVVALPGEKIAIRNGTIYINGKLLKEGSFISKDRSNFGPVKIGPDSFYVLGDNRASSYDSRAWGSLPRENIIGKVRMRIWPLGKIGFIK